MVQNAKRAGMELDEYLKILGSINNEKMLANASRRRMVVLQEYLEQIIDADWVPPEQIAQTIPDYESKKWKAPATPQGRVSDDNHRTHVSKKVKRKIVATALDGELSIVALSKRFSAGTSTIRRTLKRAGLLP
jgi:hypothetical protein